MTGVKRMILTILLILNGSIFLSAQQQFILQSTPFMKIHQNYLCKDGYINKFIEVDQDQSIFIAYSSTCGMLITQLKDNTFQILHTTKTADKVVDLAVDQIRKILYIVNNQNILLFRIVSSRSLQYIQSISNGNTDNSTKNVIITNDGKYVILINTGESVIYQIIQESSLIKIQNISSTSILKSILYLPQQLIFIIGNDQAEFYQINSNMSNGNLLINENSMCQSNEIIQPTKMVQISDQYLAFISEIHGLGIANISSYLATQTCSNIKVNYLNQRSNSSSLQFLLLTSDLNYLITLSIFKYIQIYQIGFEDDQSGNKQLTLTLFQQIKAENISYDLELTQDQQIIIYSENKYIKLFQKAQINQNQDAPNILNVSQNIIFNQYDDLTQESQRCLYHENFIYQTKGKDGLYIFQKNVYNNFLNRLGKWKQPADTYLRSVKVFKDSKLAIVGAGDLYLLDISNKSNIKQVSSSNLGDTKLNVNDICISKDELKLFIAGGQGGLYIVKANDLTPISKINDIKIQYAESSSLQIDSRNQFAFVVYRFQGIAVYDVSLLAEPKLVSFYSTGYAQDIALSNDEKFLILADRQNGIAILDISNTFMLQEISRIRLNKEIVSVKLIQNDQYIMATNVRSYGELTMIDISNKQNPQFMQSYSNKRNESGGAQDICFNSDFSIAFLSTNSDLTVMNLKSYQKYVFDLYLIKQGDNYVAGQPYQQNQEVKVGQSLNVKLNQLFPQQYAQITKILFYDNKMNIQLPNWATFNEIEQYLTIDITKEALLSQEEAFYLQYPQNVVQQKTFTFIINEVINQGDFIQNDIPISTTISSQIFNDCLIQRFIDTNLFATEYQQDTIYQIFQSQNKYSSQIINHIIHVLKSKVSFQPFSIIISNSLQTNFDSVNDNMIQTTSNVVRVELNIINKDAKFKQINYQSVSITYPNNNFALTLEGEIKAVNEILKNGISIANFSNPTFIQIVLLIDDKLNYPIKQSMYASHPVLFKLNVPITLNPELSLQDDFNNKFKDSEIYILESFIFTFQPNIFIDSDDKQLFYTAYVKIDGEFVEIPKQYWLYFSPQDRTFDGLPQDFQLGEEYEIQLIGSDGYTEAKTQFKIKLSKIPVVYVLQRFIITLCAVLAVTIFYRQRSNIYNILAKSKYTTTPQRIKSGEQFDIQIPLIEDNLQQGRIIWQSYLKSIGSDKIIKEIGIISKKYEIFQQLNRTKHRIRSPKKSQYYVPNEQQNLNTIQNTILDQEDILTESSQFNELRLSPLKQAKLIKKTQYSIINKTQYVKKLVQKKKQADDNKPFYNLIFFNEDNFEINEDISLIEIEEFYKNTKCPIQKYLKELDNPNSRLSRSILGCMVSEIAHQEKSSLSIINYLRTISLHQGYSTHDWYKPYIEITSQIDQILNNPFPSIIVLKSAIEQKITSLNQNLQPNQQPTTITLNIVYSYLHYLSLGLISNNQSVFCKIRGESLELFPYQISCIKCYRKVLVKSALTCSLRKVYMEKELSYNYRLPSWIQTLDLTHGVIFIRGNPQNKDCGTYLFKIFDKSHCIIKQFEIQIKQSSIIYHNKSYHNNNNNNNNNNYNNHIQQNFPQKIEQEIIPDELLESGINLYPNSPIHTKYDRQLINLNKERKSD